jgi:phosphate/sulfate permease
LHDENLYKPVGDKPPIWWMRGILILTCSGVSFAHGTNDGQKSIGLIMLTIIGLFPATYALNPQASRSLEQLPAILRQAEPLVTKYGDDEKQTALAAALSIEQRMSGSPADAPGAPLHPLRPPRIPHSPLRHPPRLRRPSSRSRTYATTSIASSPSSSTPRIPNRSRRPRKRRRKNSPRRSAATSSTRRCGCACCPPWFWGSAR